jgi:hypothetical protein
MKQIEDTYYYVTKEGNVYSKRTGELTLMKTYTTSHGYKALRLMINKKSKLHYIHRIVAKAFIENEFNKPAVNHIDGNKQNNSIDNLEWCTIIENNKHAELTGLTNLKGYKRKTKSVSVISKCGFFFKKFESLKLASIYFNIDSRRISEFMLGKRKHQLYNFA